jgi:hypothetical protein
VSLGYLGELALTAFLVQIQYFVHKHNVEIISGRMNILDTYMKFTAKVCLERHVELQNN